MIRIGGLYQYIGDEGEDVLHIWNHPYGMNQVICHFKPLWTFLIVEKSSLLRYWYRIIYDGDQLGWVHLNATPEMFRSYIKEIRNNENW